jgi:hypothetical protein
VSRILILIVASVCVLLFAPAAEAAICYFEVPVQYYVCTTYGDGSRSCVLQQGWEVAYVECSGGGGYYPPPPPPPGGGGYVPPPLCQIVGISDENTDQTILTVASSESVVEMSLAINGHVLDTVAGRTDQFMFDGIGAFGDGATPVTVLCRNTANDYVEPVATVYRAFDVHGTATVTHAYWQKLSIHNEPEEFWGDWYRSLDLGAMTTDYDVPTFGLRNGKYQHLETQDRLQPMGDTPTPIWDAVYWMSNPQLNNVHQAYPCRYGSGEAMCTTPNAFSHEWYPAGVGHITGMSISFQSTFGAHILAGEDLAVTPY